MEEFDLISFIANTAIIFGIIGFLMFTFSFLSGMRYIKVKGKYKLHKRIGALGFFFVTIHAFVMLYFYLFS